MPIVLCSFLVLLLPSTAQNERRLVVYTASTVYSVPITNRGGMEYVSLSDLLEPLGNVEAKGDTKKWRLTFAANGTKAKERTAEFRDGQASGKIGSQELPLAGNFFVENGRGYIPLHDAGNIAASITAQATNFREAAGRLLIGNAGIKYSLDLRIGDVRTGAPPRLVLTFAVPVNPAIATEPGKTRLTFRRDPVVPSGPENASLANPVIMSAIFSDAGGVPQITVNSTAPLVPTFADGNRTIILTPLTSTATATPPASQATPSATAPTTAPAATPQEGFLVIIDPAHGGEDRGAAITPSIAEKDVTLALARRIQHELQNRGVAANMVRQSDSTIALDDRATAANVSHASLYVCVHASPVGNGVRVFTAMMSPALPQNRRFLQWESAQSGFLDLSSQAAGSIAAELGNRKVQVLALPAPLRPMRNVASPAIAIEMAPAGSRVEQLTSGEYQQSVAVAVAQGIVAVRSRLAGAK